MATQLNLKDPVLVERARVLAARKGEPVTATIRKLVDAAWQESEQESDQRLRRMMEWADKVYANLPEDVKGMTSKEIMDSIYDDNEPDGFAR